MPQAPLPAPAARLVPQNLITPMHAGTSNPLDVIQHQWQVDYLDKAKKGAELGSMIAQLPTVGAQNVLERSYAHLATERAKALQDEIKQINTQYPGPENAQRRSMAVEDAMIRYGYKQTGTQGGFDTQVPLGVYGKDYFINKAYNNNPPPAPVQQTPKGDVQVGEVTRTDGTNTNTSDQDSLYKSRAAERLNTNDLNDPRIPAMVEQLKAEDAKAKNANPSPSPSPSPNPSPSPTPNQPGFKIPHSGGQSAMLFNPGNNGNGVQLVSGVPAANIGYPQVQSVGYPVFSPYNYNSEGAIYPNAPLA